MDNLKLYGRCEKELESLINVVLLFSGGTELEFGLNKCAVLVLKQGLKVRCKGAVLPGGQVMDEVDENGYKYLVVLEDADIILKELKVKVKQACLRRAKLMARSKLYDGNLITAINSWGIGSEVQCRDFGLE